MRYRFFDAHRKRFDGAGVADVSAVFQTLIVLLRLYPA